MTLKIWWRYVAAVVLAAVAVAGGIASCDDNDPPWPFSKP